MRGVICAAAIMLISMATAEGQQPAEQMTGCLANGHLRNLQLGDEPLHRCRGKKQVEVGIPLDVGRNIPINIEMIPAPHDQHFNIRDLIVAPGVIVKLACRTEGCRGPNILGPQSATTITNFAHLSEFDVGFLVADIMPEESNVYIQLRDSTVLFPPDARCFYRGEARVVDLGDPELDDFPDIDPQPAGLSAQLRD